MNSQKKNIYGWYLFDFANSILIINGGLYFPQWIVIDNKVGDFYYNLVLVFSSIILLISAPLLGRISDILNNKKRFLWITNLSMFFATIIAGVSAIILAEGTLKSVIALISFFIIIYTYQLSLVFYNSVLGEITSKELYSKISGRGYAFGWIGGIVGIFLILPFVQNQNPLWGPPGRIQSFLPSAIIFIILMTISLKLITIKNDIKDVQGNSEKIAIKLFDKNIFFEFRQIVSQNKSILYFLIAYLLFSDAVLTIQDNSTIYLESVMRFNDNSKALLFVELLFTAALGSILFGYLSKKIGYKKTLSSILISWSVILIIVAITNNQTAFIIQFGIIGLLYGGLWNISRVIYLLLIPQNKRGEFFGIYSSYERFASILAPLIWGGTATIFLDMGANRYRISMMLIAIIIFISFFIFQKTKQESIA